MLVGACKYSNFEILCNQDLLFHFIRSAVLLLENFEYSKFARNRALKVGSVARYAKFQAPLHDVPFWVGFATWRRSCARKPIVCKPRTKHVYGKFDVSYAYFLVQKKKEKNMRECRQDKH